MLSCREVTVRASDFIEHELPLGERVSMRMHLAICRHCRRLVRHLRQTIDLLHHTGEQPQPSGAWLEELDAQLQVRLEVSSGSASTAPAPGGGPKAVSLVQSPGDARVQTQFAEIEALLGYIPNLFRAYAHHPEVLASHWAQMKTVMLAGGLSARLKEIMALCISSDNRCPYGVDFHSHRLQQLGLPGDVVARLPRDPALAGFDPREEALLKLARVANRGEPEVVQGALRAAHTAGASPQDVIEVLAVMELVSALNRVANVLDLPRDFDDSSGSNR
ncbi:carboxymuconolactone decarboxylase family protein [Marinobacteraceae bacterium S3BR75-40.1]